MGVFGIGIGKSREHAESVGAASFFCCCFWRTGYQSLDGSASVDVLDCDEGF